MSAPSHWMLTIAGTEHFLTGVDACTNEFDIDAIAHSTAIIPRFTGHTTRPYSVAEHQLLCADIAEHLGLPRIVQLACLVHDAHEAITGDTSSPVKWTVGEAWTNFEQPIARQLRRWLGLLSTFAGHGHRIHQIDLMALATERRDLLNYRHGTNLPWPVLDTPGAAVPCASWIDLRTTKREQRHWSEWKAMWLERYHALSANHSPMEA